ncbi:hypothetical protein [uncultured Lactobacillus sp.]|uniref:hypothetical protein n=1 Tax=uncultured Lactobacillus sp. TaxID=153152 RepID=UPI002639B867|nr:hypothetical protein [uncultured Lactobacillus sp.]
MMTSGDIQLVHYINDWLFYVFIFFFALSLLAYTISNYFAKDHNVREIRIINTVIAFLDFLISFILAVITISHWHLLFIYWNKNFWGFVPFTLYVLILLCSGTLLLFRNSTLHKH